MEKGRRDGSARPPWPATQDRLKHLKEVVSRTPVCFCLARATKELGKHTGLSSGKTCVMTEVPQVTSVSFLPRRWQVVF